MATLGVEANYSTSVEVDGDHVILFRIILLPVINAN